MLTWRDFEKVDPRLAADGRALMYQFGVGLGFLATVGRDGYPRTHPVRPVITDGGMYVYVMPGPKLNDLRRDGRFAMHCFPPVNNEDGFHVTGTALELDDPPLRQKVDTTVMAESNLTELHPEHHNHPLFEFLVRNAQLTRTAGHGDYHPKHTIWKADRKA